MGLNKDISDRVKSIIDEKFVVEDINYVPDISDSKLTFGNKGLKFESTVLYIDMRGSTSILTKHNRPVVAKLHMAYFEASVKIASLLGGQVRSFNGDSLLVFFEGNSKENLSKAVQAAMQIKYMLDNENGIRSTLEKYSALDFGIGIDYGSILCTKIGLPRNANNQDLIWIGHAVNKSTVLSDNSKSPSHIGISQVVYDSLQDNVKYGIRKNFWGQDEKVDMWTKGSIQYDGNWISYYYTSWHWVVE